MLHLDAYNNMAAIFAVILLLTCCIGCADEWRFQTRTKIEFLELIPLARDNELIPKFFGLWAASQYRQTRFSRQTFEARRAYESRVFSLWHAFALNSLWLKSVQGNIRTKLNLCAKMTVLTEWYRFSAGKEVSMKVSLCNACMQACLVLKTLTLYALAHACMGAS
jgi:hypothetical protein